MPNAPHPMPRLLTRLLHWLLKESLLEEIMGDLEEYHQEIAHLPTWRRTLLYSYQTLHFLRPFALKRELVKTQIDQTAMLLNYLKTSRRALLRNPLSSLINIFGLSVSIGICLVVYAFMEYDYSIDRHHEHKDHVFLSTFSADREGTLARYGMSPRPLGALLEQDFAHVQRVCRVEDRPAIIKYQDQVFHERVRYTDPSFLKMLTFPLKWGRAEALADLNSIIISEEMAVKYFGDQNPVGEELLLKFSEDRSKSFTVSGVAATFPEARIIDFQFLLHFDNLEQAEPGYDATDWGSFVAATLIQVDDPMAIGGIKAGMAPYLRTQHKAESDWKITDFDFVSLHDLHLASGEIRNDISYDASQPGRIALPIIGLFMLLLACFNYINMAIVSAARRLKEIGLRKVMGANRGRVIIQFLTENVFITFFALALGALLALTLFLPWFADISNRALSIRALDPALWVFMVVLLLFTGIASGLYPALYISRFEAVRIFKGSVQFGKKNPLTRLFLGLQMVLACIFITGAVMYSQNSAYQSRQSWGYNQHETLYTRVEGAADFAQLRDALLQEPAITAIAGSAQHLGKAVETSLVQLPERQFEVEEIGVQPGYLETMGITLQAGRFLETSDEQDRRAVVVNDLFVERLGLEQPIGHRLLIDSLGYQIVGITARFHTHNFYHEVSPTVFTVAAPEAYRYLSLRFAPGQGQAAWAGLQTQWSALFPEAPFEGGFQEDTWTNFYQDLAMMVRFNRVIAVIAILLACLGLYGLIALNLSGRVREFSIRKVLGAGLGSLARTILRQYLPLGVIALALGAPLSYYLIRLQIASMFVYTMPDSISGVTLAVLLLALALLLVILSQVRRLSKMNPVNGLKTE